MKTLLCLFLIAAAASPRYLVLPADTVLYSATADGYAPICTLPATYYVIALGDDRDGYTAVSWLDVNGFIRSADAQAVDYQPVYPHCTRTLTAANDLNPVNIRSSPDHTADNVVGVLPHGKTADVYGEADGSALIPQVGSLWYYIRYSDGTTVVTGYVYGAQVNAQAVTPNTGERVTPPATEPIDTESTMPAAARAVLIIALCVPAVLIVLLIFRPSAKPSTPRSL